MLVAQQGFTIRRLTDDDNTPLNQMLSIVKTADAAEPSTNGNFRISLPGDYVSSASLNIVSTETGTATYGVDYTVDTPILPAYQHSIDVPVTVLDDALNEPTEILNFTLGTSFDGNGDSYTADPANGPATLNITDDDSPLPLNLFSFTGHSQANGQVFLEWETALEHNADYFNLECSPDRNNFSPIEKVTAQGEGNNQYTTVDVDPLPVGYYRLQIVDEDQSAKYSEVIKVQDDQQNSSAIYLYPNPAKGQVTLKIGNGQLLNTKAILTNVTGQIKQTITLNQQSQIISLAHYAAGIYFLKFANGQCIKLIIH